MLSPAYSFHRIVVFLIGSMKEYLMKRNFYVQNQGYKNQKVDSGAIVWPLVHINRNKHLNNNKEYVINREDADKLDESVRKLVEII